MLRAFRPLLVLAALSLAAVLASCASNDLTNQVLQAHVSVVSVMPKNDSTGVSVLAPGVASFLDPVDSREASVLSWTLTDADGHAVPGTVDVQGSTASFTPDAALQPFTAYRYTITTGVRMQRGQLVRDLFEWSFSTGAAPPTRPN